MAVRISKWVINGELRNDRRNSVHGWIGLSPEFGLQFELAGNLKGQFAGRAIRFCKTIPDSQPTQADNLPEFVDSLAKFQIGAVGTVKFRDCKIPKQTPEEVRQSGDARGKIEYDMKPVLYLEWYGQNGRIVAEIKDPNIEFLGDQATLEPVPEPLSQAAEIDGLSVAPLRCDDANKPILADLATDVGDPPDYDLESDPYGLFSVDLDMHIRQSLGPSNSDTHPQASSSEIRKRPTWDEVLPGIDPVTKAMYEKWDDIYSGENEEPISSLFDPPLALPPADSVQTDEEAEPLLMSAIASLAQTGVAYDLCEHCKPLFAYRVLVDQILPETHVHPRLTETQIIEHIPLYEFCPQCLAELEGSSNWW